MKKIFSSRARFFALSLLAAALVFAGCNLNSDDDDDELTVKFYADTISIQPRTASIEKGAVFSCPQSYLRAPDDNYTFTAWVSSDGTNYTNTAITKNITLFAEFTKTTSEANGTITTTTVSDVYVVQAKTSVEEYDSSTNETTKSETIVKKDTSGNILTQKVTEIAADGSSSITYTDESGQTTTTKKDASGNVISESTDYYLDLRIKKDGVPINASALTLSEGAAMGNSVSTAHVTATPVNGGVKFVVTRPTDDCYADGFGWCSVYDEYGTTAVFSDTYAYDSSKTTMSMVFPLSTYGKKSSFTVHIENAQGIREYIYNETIEITTTSGIGYIDYQNIDKKNWMSMTYTNKPVLTIDPNMILMTALEVQPHYEFWASDSVEYDWGTTGAVEMICKDYLPDDSSWVSYFNEQLEAIGKKYFRVQFSYEFKLPNCNSLGIQKIRTNNFLSETIQVK